MAPPALAIVGGVVVVAGMTVAFHHFVYEPHIAPKIEILIENWLEKRRVIRRRLASLSVNVDSDDEHALPMNTYSPSSQANKFILTPLKSSSLVTETTTNTLRRRVKSATVEAPSVIETPNSFIPFDTLNPVVSNTSSSEDKANVGSRSSTPSTISSSILAMQSPSIHPESPPGLDALSDHSRGASSFADSILADAHDNSPLHSPVHSVTHISPRTFFITLSPTISSEGARSPALAEGHTDSTIFPSLAYHSAQESLSRESSPARGLSQSPQARSPDMSPHLEMQSGPAAGPLTAGNGQLSAATRTSRSNASWSDIASSHGEDPEILIGSDAESWAHLSDRA